MSSNSYVKRGKELRLYIAAAVVAGAANDEDEGHDLNDMHLFGH